MPSYTFLLKVEADIVILSVKEKVCKSCGERYYDRETMEMLEEIKRSKSGEIVETIVVLKDIPYSEAKNKIEDYLKTHKTAYMYEVSNDLGLDLKMVHEIVEQLIKEGKVE